MVRLINKRVHQPHFDILHIRRFKIIGLYRPHHPSPPGLRLIQFTVPADSGRISGRLHIKIIRSLFFRIISQRQSRNNIDIPDGNILIRKNLRLPYFPHIMVRTLFFIRTDMSWRSRRHPVKHRIHHIPGQPGTVIPGLEPIPPPFRKLIRHRMI